MFRLCLSHILRHINIKPLLSVHMRAYIAIAVYFSGVDLYETYVRSFTDFISTHIQQQQYRRIGKIKLSVFL